MICDDCKNNKDGFCQICIFEDGNKKPISKDQVGCGFKNKDIGYDMRDFVLEKSDLELRIEVLEEKIKNLPEKEVIS